MSYDAWKTRAPDMPSVSDPTPEWETYRHPNGTRPLTLAGLIRREADITGEEHGALFDSILADIRADELRHEQTAADWGVEALNKVLTDWVDVDYVVLAIVEVLAVRCVHGYDGSDRGMLDCIAICSDRCRRLVLRWRDWPGSYYEPPDSDRSLEEVYALR